MSEFTDTQSSPTSEPIIFPKSLDTDKDFKYYLKECKNYSKALDKLYETNCISVAKDLKCEPVLLLFPELAFSLPHKSTEELFNLMILLFIKIIDENIKGNYTIVYDHLTSLNSSSSDLFSQYPLISKCYSILPRLYKKNLKTFYILHSSHNIYNFFNVFLLKYFFLSSKLYNKMVFFDNILEFQKVLPPNLINLPIRLIKNENDRINKIRYHNILPLLKNSFNITLGTSYLNGICGEFIRSKLKKKENLKEIFRVPGNEAGLFLSKIRLQYAHTTSFNSKDSRIYFNEKNDTIIIGNLDLLYLSDAEEKLKENPTPFNLPPEPPMPIITISEVNTIAQIFKFSLRDMANSLLPLGINDRLINSVRNYINTSVGTEGSESSNASKYNLNYQWEIEAAEILSTLPLENLSTLIYVIDLIREISRESAQNNMDSTNLSIVFAPTIFSASMNQTTNSGGDINLEMMKAAMTLGVTPMIVQKFIDRPIILCYAVRLFYDNLRQLDFEKELSNLNFNDTPNKKITLESFNSMKADDVFSYNRLLNILLKESYQKGLSSSSFSDPSLQIITNIGEIATNSDSITNNLDIEQRFSSTLTDAVLNRVVRGSVRYNEED